MNKPTGWATKFKPTKSDPNQHGIMMMGTSALLELDRDTGKGTHTFVEILPVLANNGFEIVIPKGVAERILNSKAGEETALTRLLVAAMESRPEAHPHIVIEPTEHDNDSRASLKDAIRSYGAGREIFVVTNETKNFIAEVNKEFPDVNLVTTTALLKEMVQTGLDQHIPAIHGKHMNAALSPANNPVPPIDATGPIFKLSHHASLAARGHTSGPMADELKVIKDNYKDRRGQPREEQVVAGQTLEAAIGDPSLGSHVAALKDGRENGNISR